MMKKIKFKLLFILLLPLSLGLQAQVTIGTTEEPVLGALLQIKDKVGITTDEANSSKGIGIPRVKLTDKNKLYPMFSTGYNAVEDAKHSGLIVFHTDQCALNGRGIYVWTGAEWTNLGELTQSPPTLTFNQEYFDLPSGRDARPLNAQTLNITWASTGTGVPLPTWTAAASNELLAVPFTTTPLSPMALTVSPTAMTLLPDVLAAPDMTAMNPWHSKETKLTFTYDDCGITTKNIVLNQTNYALVVNNSSINSQLNNTSAGTKNFQVTGNATWEVALNNPNNLVSSIIPAENTTAGRTLKNGGIKNTQFTYTTHLGLKYQSADFIFKDSETPPRFNDITVSLMNCTPDPTLAQWVTAHGGAINTSNSNDVQWHRDQNNNIFFSAQFGTKRWMTTNLAATSFVTVGRTGTDNTIRNGQITGPNLSTGLSYNAVVWAYPGGANTVYNNNNRYGLLYTWAAASNSQGGVSGTNGTQEGGNASLPRIQGICPNGWHLPSDWEWTELENEIISNTATYSTTPTIGGPAIPQTPTLHGYRGTLQGKAMRDACENFVGEFNGTSHAFLQGGFSVMLAGYIAAGTVTDFNQKGTFWSRSSTENSSTTWARLVSNASNAVYRGYGDRWALFSVRCVQD